MLIKIGPSTHSHFQVLAKDGTDITDKLDVRAMHFDAQAGNELYVTLEVRADVEVELYDGDLRLTKTLTTD